MSHRRFRSDAGIAIGPILFVIALLGILAAVIAAGTGDFGSASISDRIAADIASQANLIRAKINECNIMYGTSSNYDGYPSSDTTSGTAVSALNCTGDAAGSQNLWSGERPALLPPPTAGFNTWTYLNSNGSGLGGTAADGRCFWITPNLSNPKDNAALVAGLKKAASKFTANTGYDASSEVIYDPASDSQKFTVWISIPASAPSSGSPCLP